MTARSVLVMLSLSLVLALGVAACGGDDDGDDEAAPPAATETDGGAGAEGEAIFTENCGTCHVLAASGTSGTTGPSLDEVMPSEETVETQVRNGGGGMPAFEGQLTDEEIAAVSSYVAENAGG
jgi:mono/diheme cytochrome c family protein